MLKRKGLGTMAFAVLMIAMLLAVDMPAGAQPSAASHTITLEVYEASRPTVPVAGASVTFVDAHTGAAYRFITNASGGVSFAPSGAAYFKVLINATGFYDYRYYDAVRVTDFVRFDETKDVSLGAVYLTKLPAATNLVSIAISGPVPSTGVDVRIAYAGILDQTAYEASLNASTSIMLPSGNYRLTYAGAGVQPNAYTFTVSGARSLDVSLAASSVIIVNITQGGFPDANATAYLVSKQKAELGRMLVEPRQRTGSTLLFDAYPGSFYLVVGSALASARVVEVTLPLASVDVDLSPRVSDRTSDTFQVSNLDWNAITLTSYQQLQGDSTSPMMLLSAIPSFRMQLDLDPTVGGNGNGVVDAQEVYNYTEMMKRMGPDNITTAGLATVEGFTLISDANQIEYAASAAGLISTPVSSEAEYTTTLTVKYAPLGGTIVNGKGSYIFILNPAYNTTFQGWSYKVRLPTDYVLLGASLYKDPVTIGVSDYTTISIESPSYRPGDRRPALVSLPIVTAKEPSASVVVVISPSTYQVGQDTYIIRSGVEMSFNAAASFDPNGNPLTYLWTFGDGGMLTTASAQVRHTYWIPDLNVTMTLTVRDVSLRTATANLTLKIDGVDPTPVILVNGTAPGAIINVDQMQSVEYSAADSYDLIYNEAVPQGIVKRVDWAFGDGSYANGSTVARHAYSEPGLFNLTLRITDAGGRVTESVYVVNVHDTKGPEVVINITRAADGSPITASAVAGDLLLFDGSNSTDPGGIVSYVWQFGDGTNASGARVQHTYTAARTVTGRLTCTDAAGNSAYRPFTLTILPSLGPDLRITDMVFDPSSFMEGSGGTVQITIINVGSATARNISTSFYLAQAGGDQLLVKVDGVTVGGAAADHLDIGQTGKVTASLSFSSAGSNTIRANSTTDGETNPGDNTRSATLQVQENGWKYAGIYFGLIFLAVVIIALLYMRRGATTGKGKKGKKGKKR